MKQLATTLLSLFILGSANAEDPPPPPHQHTSPSPTARFEVLQSSLAARWTFRLDRYSGRIWQLVRTKDDENTWQEMPITDLPKVQSPTRPRFQLFTSGLAARFTFLLDGETGRTWVVTTNKGKRPDGTEFEFMVWQSFAD